MSLLRTVIAAGALVLALSPTVGATSLPDRTFRVSTAPDLSQLDGDTDGVSDVFVRDLQTGRTALVSAAPGGGPANGPSGRRRSAPGARSSASPRARRTSSRATPTALATYSCATSCSAPRRASA